jgi:hypothetical protein
VTGAIGGLLLTSLGLELLAHQAFGPTDVAALLLAEYLAVWLSGLSIVAVLVLSIAWLMEGRLPAGRTAALSDDRCLQAAMIPSMSGKRTAEEQHSNRPPDFTRVA